VPFSGDPARVTVRAAAERDLAVRAGHDVTRS
jgi:hypothetical protein